MNAPISVHSRWASLKHFIVLKSQKIETEAVPTMSSGFYIQMFSYSSGFEIRMNLRPGLHQAYRLPIFRTSVCFFIHICILVILWGSKERGMVCSLPLWFNRAIGFRLNCQGCWLAREGSPSEWLTLEFQPSGSVLGDGTTWAWMHSFECFQQRLDVLELCTIFDRQPLEAVQTWSDFR